MYITGIDPSLFISNPSQLKVGMELWQVGQGGVSTITEPQLLGWFVKIGPSKLATDFDAPHNSIYYKPAFDWKYSETLDVSMLDNHVLPQMYNNWYLCESQEKADQLYQALTAAWNINPKYELDRREFIRQCDEWDRYTLSNDYD